MTNPRVAGGILSPLPGRAGVIGVVTHGGAGFAGLPWAKGFGPCRGGEEGFDSAGPLSIEHVGDLRYFDWAGAGPGGGGCGRCPA